MKAAYWLLVGGVLVALVASMLWLVPSKTAVTSQSLTTQEAQQPSAADVSIKSNNASLQADSPEPPQQAANDRQQRDTDYPLLRTDAILSLRNARLHGDPRTPPMSPLAERKKPTEEQLSSPENYAEYERAQQLTLYRHYISAVPKKVETIEKALERASQPGSGITQEQLEFARQKIAALKAMKAKLLKENPALREAKPEEKPLAK